MRSTSRRELLQLDYPLAGGNVLRVSEVVRDKRYELRLFRGGEDGSRVGSVLEVNERFWRKVGSLKYTIRQVRELLALSLGVPDVGSLPSSSSLSSPAEINTLAEEIENQYQSCVVSEQSEDNRILRDYRERHIVDESLSGVSLLGGSQAWLFFTMYTTVTSRELGEDENGLPVIQRVPLLISSKKDVYRLDRPKELLEAGLVVPVIPDMDFNRWSKKSILRFLDNDPEPRHFVDLPQTVADLLKNYIEFSEGDDTHLFHALWIIGTYFHRLFAAYPYVFLNGVKAAGKTKTLNVTHLLAYNPILSVGMSSSSLFRLADIANPTLLIDESENLSDKERQQSFREMLLSGYKNSAKTYRTEERSDNGVKKYSVREFEVYCPKMIANIAGVEDILESRCISLVMKPALDQAVSNAEPDDTDPAWQNIRDRLYECMMVMAAPIKEVYDSLENDGFFKNREWELWKPILALARAFDEEHYARMLEFAKVKVEESRKENRLETIEYVLVGELVSRVAEDGWHPLKDLRRWLSEALDYDWGEAPEWLNSRYVSNVCRRIGFREKRRVGGGFEILFKRKEIVEQAKRMNLPLTSDDKAEWLLDYVRFNDKTTARAELAFKMEFGGTQEAADEFWDALQALKTEGKVIVDDETEVIKALGQGTLKSA